MNINGRMYFTIASLIATHAVFSQSASAMPAATYTPGQTGGVSTDRMAKYNTNICEAIGSNPILVRDGATTAAPRRYAAGVGTPIPSISATMAARPKAR